MTGEREETGWMVVVNDLPCGEFFKDEASAQRAVHGYPVALGYHVRRVRRTLTVLGSSPAPWAFRASRLSVAERKP